MIFRGGKYPAVSSPSAAVWICRRGGGRRAEGRVRRCRHCKVGDEVMSDEAFLDDRDAIWGCAFREGRLNFNWPALV